VKAEEFGAILMDYVAAYHEDGEPVTEWLSTLPRDRGIA
jgi:hypothetical protein